MVEPVRQLPLSRIHAMNAVIISAKGNISHTSHALDKSGVISCDNAHATGRINTSCLNNEIISEDKKRLEKSVLELERIYKDERINYILGTIKSLVETGGGALAISGAAQLPTWANILALGSGGLLGFGYSLTRQTNGFAYLYDLYNYNMVRR